MRKLAYWALAILISLAAAPVQSAEKCTRDAFKKVVDDTGSALRRLHAESQPKIQAGFKRLKEKRGWSEEEHQEKANALLTDERTEAFDAKSSELLAKLDRLAEEAPANSTDCVRLGELEATALELQATVRAKTQYMLTQLDAAIGDAPKTAAAAPPQELPPPPAPPPTAQKQPAAPPALTAAPPPPVAAVPPPPKPKPRAPAWSTNTVGEVPKPLPPFQPNAPAPPTPGPVQTAPLPPPQQTPSDDSYSIDEIREATRGFFGSVSTGLASVIEHAFSKLGRPTGYVLGQEGGGAFLAGVRYGKGTLFLRGAGTREVFWHGPSIGYDVGAAGSKTLFLVYNLHDPVNLFSGFTGVDGSAYLVGGFGFTVLTDGNVVMAPIRSGVGLRLGASIGYIRFTARPTWNPF